MLPKLFLKTQNVRGGFESMTYTSQFPGSIYANLIHRSKYLRRFFLTNKLVGGTFSKEISLTQVLLSDRFRVITTDFSKEFEQD